MTNNTVERLRAMKMNAFASELERQIEDSGSYGQLAFGDRLSLLVDSEWNRRQNNRLSRYIRNARCIRRLKTTPIPARSYTLTA